MMNILKSKLLHTLKGSFLSTKNIQILLYNCTLKEKHTIFSNKYTVEKHHLIKCKNSVISKYLYRYFETTKFLQIQTNLNEFSRNRNKILKSVFSSTYELPVQKSLKIVSNYFNFN